MRYKPRVRLRIVGDDERGLVERVAACPVPRAVVGVERTAKCCASGGAEDAPRGNQIGGGIADPGTAEVNDRAKPTAVDEQVGPKQIRMDPYRRTIHRQRFERKL